MDKLKRHQNETREELLNEVEEFEKEREQLREVLGKIGGKNCVYDSFPAKSEPF